jgi:hypothetical protein
VGKSGFSLFASWNKAKIGLSGRKIMSFDTLEEYSTIQGLYGHETDFVPVNALKTRFLGEHFP